MTTARNFFITCGIEIVNLEEKSNTSTWFDGSCCVCYQLQRLSSMTYLWWADKTGEYSAATWDPATDNRGILLSAVIGVFRWSAKQWANDSNKRWGLRPRSYQCTYTVILNKLIIFSRFIYKFVAVHCICFCCFVFTQDSKIGLIRTIWQRNLSYLTYPYKRSTMTWNIRISVLPLGR